MKKVKVGVKRITALARSIVIDQLMVSNCFFGFNQILGAQPPSYLVYASLKTSSGYKMQRHVFFHNNESDQWSYSDLPSSSLSLSSSALNKGLYALS